MKRRRRIRLWACLTAVSALAGAAALSAVLALGAENQATIEATKFTVDQGQTGEEFAKCGGSKRALGGGVVQSGSPAGLFVGASGPLDATGVTLNTRDGDVAKQWYAAVTNGAGDDDRVFKVFAICV